MKVKLIAEIPLDKLFFDFYTVLSISIPTQLTSTHDNSWLVKGKVNMGTGAS